MILNRNFFIDIHSHHIPGNIRDTFALINHLITGPGDVVPDCDTFFSAGIHPWHSGNFEISKAKKILRNLAEHQNCLAIGECGFDLVKGPTLDIQERIFDAHFKLSEALKKPMIIHCVKAYNQLLLFKKRHSPTVPWIIHGYNSNLQIARELVKHKVYISLGKALTAQGSNAFKILPLLPQSLLFFETDDQKIGINEVYYTASERMNIDLDQLKEIIFNNFQNCFRITL